MPFSTTNSIPTHRILVSLAVVSVPVIILGVLRDYSFLPNRGSDGFLQQIDYVRQLLSSENWSVFWSEPLSFIHALRYAVVWPFLAAEQTFGSAGSLTLLIVLLWPLLILFRPQRGGWRDLLYFAVRFAVLLLPLFVSGRTVLVTAGMGYMVAGIMLRPFSGWRMFLGCLVAVLSSASILFSIGVLILAGNWRDRSKAFYACKAFFLVLVIGLFMPSLFVKAEGFSAGAVGYALEDSAGEEGVLPPDTIGSGPVAAVQRILMRSTVVQSYREGNVARLALYCALFAAAWAYILWSMAVKHRHPMVIVLALISTGIFLEGLALWHIVFPLVWAYTGIVRTNRNQSQPCGQVSS